MMMMMMITNVDRILCTHLENYTFSASLLVTDLPVYIARGRVCIGLGTDVYWSLALIQ